MATLVRRARLLPQWARVRAAWGRGMRREPLPPEPPDALAIDEGRSLAASAVSRARGRFADLPLRVFIVRPQTITGALWFDGIVVALRHMGVAADIVGDGDRDWGERWRALQPTAVVAPDRDDVVERLGGSRLLEWARSGGRRVLVAHAPAGFPASDRRNADEEERLRLALAGATADGFCSLFEPEYFTAYALPLARAGFPYLALPQACDPFNDAPRDVSRRHAWFLVSTLTPDRLEVTVETLLPILRAHPGLWAGSGWRFGAPRIDSRTLPEHFGSARIALAPLVAFNRERPLEISYRVFAAAANGAFQITHATPVTGRFFTGDELVQAGSAREFAELFEHYLPRREERAAVARRALARVFRDHTTFERAERLVRFVRSLPGRA